MHPWCKAYGAKVKDAKGQLYDDHKPKAKELVVEEPPEGDPFASSPEAPWEFESADVRARYQQYFQLSQPIPS